MGRKWANIVAKKTAKDGANSKVYAKFGVEIYVAAKKGEPDPESNSALKFVLERAKQAQVPKHIIDRAIDKAKGNTDETFVEGRYEGFGPNGSMIIVDTLTSNVNRTAANLRTFTIVCFCNLQENFLHLSIVYFVFSAKCNIFSTISGKCVINTKFPI